MFEKGQMVVYGTSGVCRIEDIREERFSAASRETHLYYVLKPLDSPASTKYVPVHNDQLIAKMRPVPGKEEIDAMLRSTQTSPVSWISDPRHRTEAYTRIFAGGVGADLIALIRCLRGKKQERVNAGKRLYAADEKLLAAAEQMVCDEFAYALEIDKADVPGYILRVCEGPSENGRH